MKEVTEKDTKQTAKAIALIHCSIEECIADGMTDFNINAALAMILQGRGVTPEAYALTFEEGKAVYEDFQQYHTDDDGSVLPPPHIVP